MHKGAEDIDFKEDSTQEVVESIKLSIWLDGIPGGSNFKQAKHKKKRSVGIAQM